MENELLLRLTSKGAGGVEDFIERFSDRLSSLERTQDALSRNPAARADLRDIVAAELEAHGVPPGDQVEIEGERIQLARRTAQALASRARAVDERAQYGALAHGGHVRTSWARSADGQRLVFRWRETGVPGGTRGIEGGFGSKLIREVVPYMLGGTSELEMDEDGVRCLIEVPLEQEEDGTGPEHRAAGGDED